MGVVYLFSFVKEFIVYLIGVSLENSLIRVEAEEVFKRIKLIVI